jgi:hypothetical protein
VFVVERPPVYEVRRVPARAEFRTRAEHVGAVAELIRWSKLGSLKHTDDPDVFLIHAGSHGFTVRANDKFIKRVGVGYEYALAQRITAERLDAHFRPADVQDTPVEV